MKQLICTLFFISVSFFHVYAQTLQQNSGWLMILNSTKFNDKWGMHLDVQLRTFHEWAGVRNILFRPGLSYYINSNSNATLGYLLADTRLKLEGASKNQLTEHRIWEQYIFNHKIKSLHLQHRFRLEQRFIETMQEDIFAQRLRYFFRFLQPLGKEQVAFTKGPFAALQNELFFNVQNKEKLNQSFFDQNRSYGAIGYRFSKGFDVELGYMNQLTNGIGNDTMNHAVQLAFYTRF